MITKNHNTRNFQIVLIYQLIGWL